MTLLEVGATKAEAFSPGSTPLTLQKSEVPCVRLEFLMFLPAPSCRNQGSVPQSAPKANTSLWPCKAGERSCENRDACLVIIFKGGGEEERGSQCVLLGGLRTKLPGGDREVIINALITEEKRLNLAGPEKIIGKTCMNLKAPFTHVTSREAAVGNRAAKKRTGKWFRLHSLIQKPFLTSVSIPKLAGFLYIKSSHIPLKSQHLSQDHCSFMTTLVPKTYFHHGR